MSASIPQPPGAWPFIGHGLQLDPDVMLKSFEAYARDHGEIYQLNLFEPVVVCSSYSLVNELSDEKRFRKAVPLALKETRAAVGDG